MVNLPRYIEVFLLIEIVYNLENGKGERCGLFTLEQKF